MELKLYQQQVISCLKLFLLTTARYSNFFFTMDAKL